jgi:hypothetical protein
LVAYSHESWPGDQCIAGGCHPTGNDGVMGPSVPPSKVCAMADSFDVDAMVVRFKARARAVRQRGIPPVEGPERRRFMDQARIDFQDYAMIGDAEASLQDGILTLTIDLRPPAD